MKYPNFKDLILFENDDYIVVNKPPFIASLDERTSGVVDGQFQFDNLFIELPILNDGNRSVTIDRAEGKRAETYFNSIKYYKHYTLVECKPITGRMHQIRIHLATQRAAICGDHMYKGKPVFLSSLKKGYRLSKYEEELPIMKRFALHAKQIVFKGIDGKDISVDAPYPKDFTTLLKLLDKFDS